MPLPFLAPGQLKRCGLPDDGIVIANPLVAEESILRTSLLPGLVAALGYNASHRNHGVGLFEIGHVFNRPDHPDAELPDEREHLALVLAGRDATDAVQAARLLAQVLRAEGLRLEAAELPGLHPTRSARLVSGGIVIGAVGEIDPAVLDAHGVPERAAWVEIDLDRLGELPRAARAYRPFSLFPSSDVDLAFEVDEGVPAAALEDELRAAGGDLLWSVQLFDAYRGPGVGEGRRSLAFTLRFQAPDRTLTDDEVAQARADCIAAVEARLPASLRT
jgi:phenylalanyl-tRNA synthetase beta chain